MKNLLACCLIALGLVGCATPPAAEKTSLQVQAFQARNFEADKATAFRAVLSVLQDLGYVVNSASLETGFITAESPTKIDTSGEATFAAVFGGVRTQGKTAVTAAVEDFGKNTSRVRLNLVDKKFRSARYGQQASDEKMIEDPAVYQRAFDKIGEAIFIRKGQN